MSMKFPEETSPQEMMGASVTVLDVIARIETMSVADLVQLNKSLKERWGVLLASYSGTTTHFFREGRVLQPVDDDDPAPASPLWQVALITHGPQKLAVIKIVRESVPSFSVREARDWVDQAQDAHGTPLPIDLLSHDDATALAQRFTEVGALVAMLPYKVAPEG